MLKITEHANDSLYENIKNQECILNTQWWLYKGALTRQPIETSFYRDWFRLYKDFNNAIEILKTDEDSIEAAKILKDLFYELESQRLKLKPVLYNDTFNSLDSAIYKLRNGIKNILEEIGENYII